MATSTESTHVMVPSELVPIFKNHASMPLVGTSESLKEIVTNHKYPNPYECRVHSGSAPVDESDGYYIPEIGLPGNCWWFIKYFPFDTTGNGTQLAIPLDLSQTPKYRGSTTSGYTGWVSLDGGGVRSTPFTITPESWIENSDVSGYNYRATIEDVNILISMDANITISLSSMAIAQDAQIAPSGATFNGGIYIYSKSVPSSNIEGTYALFNV